MDPQNGRFGKALTMQADGKMRVKLQCEPGEAMIIRTYNTAPPASQDWVYLHKERAVQTINGEWSLHFTDGGPEMPADQKITQLKSWTLLGDPKAVIFAGSGVYTNTFTMEALSANEYLLQLGQVNESAHVWINGKDAGIVWGIPFQIKIKEFLQPGVNTIKIEVANLMANG
jgi:hypothetical protein